MTQKLILGTVQFGSDYGIKHDGQPSFKEIEHISEIAWDGGIRAIHTSWEYGCHEIINKLFKKFDRLAKMKYRPKYFLWLEYNPLHIRRGKSVYELSDINEKYGMHMVPINPVDDRFKIFAKKNNGIVIARSVFLQGLLLMETLPSWISSEAQKKIKEFKDACRTLKLQCYEAALGYVLGLDEIDHVIVGVNSAHQLEQLLAVKPLKWDYDFSITDENVLDPRRWPKV